MKTTTAASNTGPEARLGLRLLATIGALGLTLLLGVGNASAAAKQPVDFIGGLGARGGQFAEGGANGVAVNESGAGPASQGDIYVTDDEVDRIQRFARDDHGTPADGSDDTYSFISAWGADVDSSDPGFGYEVCTIASACQEGTSSPVNGGLSGPAGIAVDQDSGDVYVADTGNNRVSAYAGDGVFLRTFGFDVVASGPDDAGAGYEVCVAANGDVCKAGLPGSAMGQIGAFPANSGNEMGIAISSSDGNLASGSVFLADRANQRIDTYGLDGSSPASIGSASVFLRESPRNVAVDSRGILYASNGFYFDASVERYDTENANGGGVGFLAPISAPTNERDLLRLEATSGQFRLSFDPDEGGPEPAQVTSNLPLNVTAAQIQAALELLPAIGAGNIGLISPSFENGHPLYVIEFGGALARTNLPPLTVKDGSEPISPSGSVYIDSTAPATSDGADGPLESGKDINALYVEPDLDGGGPDTDILSVLLAGNIVDQLGPTNQPGLSSPPAALDASLAIEGVSGGSGLASDEASGRIYLAGVALELGSGVVVLDTPGPGPSATLDSLSDVTATSVTAHATITPNGPPALSYHLEYSTDGVKWESGPTVVLGSQKSPQSVSQVLDLGGAGLEPSTFYHLRLVAKRPFFPAIVTPEMTFTTLPAPPLAETMGSPVRTTTTARLDGRVSPQNAAATYHFEYGSEGPCDSNPCASTESHPAGSSGGFQLVSQQVEGLQPGAPYHYRVVADNGNPGSPVAGEDMTLTTFASEAPLSHGHLPGPPGSDRAWELVSAPDTGGNPVGAGLASGATTISGSGERAVYGVAGGTPFSEVGFVNTQLFAERTPSGWKTRNIFPAREDATGPLWTQPGGPADLSSMVSENLPSGNGFNGEFSLWRLRPDAPATKLYSNPDLQFRGGLVVVSDDGSRVLTTLEKGSFDPAHPVPSETLNLYDVSSGPPQLVDLLPDGTVAPCGVAQATPTGEGLSDDRSPLRRTVSADGSLVFFPTAKCGHIPQRLYVRDIPAGATELISRPPVSGLECAAQFIKSIPGTVFFYTQSRLVSEDVEPASCVEGGQTGGGDVYSYDLGDGGLDCLTCVAPGLDGEVLFPVGSAANIGYSLGVAEDGSRIYFTSGRRLTPGAPAQGGIYRLNEASGDIAYVGAFGFIGDIGGGSVMNADGSVVVFKDDDPSLDALGGQHNGGTTQYYRYDDRDRSLICVSCPADGSAPLEASPPGPLSEARPGANLTPLSRDGEDFVFTSVAPLVAADQNTARAGQKSRVGTDVYEWRSGRLLLVSDGLTNWPDAGPIVQGITPSGRDVFFTAATQYTQDALDGYSRLYDARIGGGFEFPPPPKPCPLEVCQGTPKGAPEEQAPGSASITGVGNASRPGRIACAKPKRKVRRAGKTRCVKPAHKRHQSHKRANHKRRAAR